MKLVIKTLAGQGTAEIHDDPLGKGGEGSVFTVLSHTSDTLPPASNIVAKIYHDKGDKNRAMKIASMLKNPPSNHSGIAWPLGLLLYPNGDFAGYVMNKLDKNNYREWLNFANAKNRKQTAESFSVQYAIMASRNFLVALQSVHQAGHCLGDINESNVLVDTTAQTVIIDTDSAQIVNNGRTFHCTVVKPEFVAPELVGADLKTTLRTNQSDMFATSVMIFQILANGHPTDGKYLGQGEPPAAVKRIQNGIYPTLQNVPNFERLSRIASDGLPSVLKKLILAGLQVDPSKRPTVDVWVKVFDDLLHNLVQCEKVEQHYYDSRDGNCTWCIHAQNGGFDPWNPNPQLAATQRGLPSLNFQNESQGFTAPRKQIQTPQAAQFQPAPQNAYQTTPQGGYGAPQQQSQGNVPQAYQNASQGNYEPQAPQEPPAPEPELPRKYKGKMILEYADGTRDVRPPMSQLIKHNPKMAWYCFREETPKFIRSWWSAENPVATMLGLFIGLAVGLALTFVWLFTANKYLLPMIPESLDIWNTIANYVALGSAVTAALGVLYLFFSGLIDRIKSVKRYGADRLNLDKVWVTPLRFLLVPVFYGPGAVVLLVFLVLYMAVALIMGIFNGNRR